MTVRKPYHINAKQNEADVYLYDDIGDSWDGATAKSFAADLKSVGAVRTLNIYINSPGGSVFDGVAIFNQLRRHQARKNVLIDGIAASIASVVAMAGDTIEIAANGFMMIHDPWAMAMGDAREFRKMADQLDQVRGAILNTYAERTGQALNVIGDMMAEETWMDAEQALELGFADKITKEAEMAARFDLSKFEHVPEILSKIDVEKNPPNLTVVVDDRVKNMTPAQKSELCAVVEAQLAKNEPPDLDGAHLDARLAEEERYLEKISA